mmetsp:Transcript_5914/g.14029  ORF Transcript_5914/g.14029 Transcript_5914/m.14029 type:complete len:184 (+) Transcript_5914:119-670(+)|eukprot:CAMPEP_0171060196 /NCGR_PEP_ID=MMETSP0766_2-20121228/3680_1 /TAXON_ID=439317 /ORGANISM="Gambierdiscus australes, Strain CAWD 149" /LENGTH=183 /DNA_ID=CAMNT_0011515747 /DNA_START=90 /DNA_END=641 /DNA_ORIENTATION=+
MVGTLNHGGFGVVPVGSRPSITLPSEPFTGGRLSNRAGITDVMMGRRPSLQPRVRQAPWESARSQPVAKKPKPNPQYPVPDGLRLPQWLEADAHLAYRSKSLGKDVEAIVELVDKHRCEVELSFVTEGHGRKVVPFGLIASPDNPLLGPWQSEVSRAKPQPMVEKAEGPRATVGAGPTKSSEG